MFDRLQSFKAKHSIGHTKRGSQRGQSRKSWKVSNEYAIIGFIRQIRMYTHTLYCPKI